MRADGGCCDSPFPPVRCCWSAVAGLLASPADAQVRRGPRVAARTTIVIGSGYYYRPYWYDPWYSASWYPPPIYARGGYYYRDSASLRLQVTPRQAEVFIDGYYAGVVDDFDGTFQHLNLEPGEHELQLFLEGYRPMSQRIYLQPHNTFRVRHTMEPLAPGEPQPPRPAVTAPPRGSGPGQRSRTPAAPPRDPRAGAQSSAVPAGEYGAVAIRVQPGDAAIMIDGERWQGSSDDERLVIQLAPGSHRIQIRKDGYRDFTGDVNIRPGETAPLNVSLTRR